MSLAGLRKHLRRGRRGSVPSGYSISSTFTEEEISNLPHVVICLFGEFKAETGTDYHMVIAANVTTSGLEVRWWLEKLVEVCEQEGRKEGPVFLDEDHKLGCLLDYDALLTPTYCRYLVPSIFQLVSFSDDTIVSGHCYSRRVHVYYGS